MNELRVTLACGDYDRVAALKDGRVRPDGVAHADALPRRTGHRRQQVPFERLFAPSTLAEFKI
jgi:hypothetical protein